MSLLQAVKRVGLGGALYVMQILVGFILTVSLMIYFVLDVLNIAIGWGGLNSLAFVERLWDWYIGNAEAVVFGDGSWSWLP